MAVLYWKCTMIWMSTNWPLMQKAENQTRQKWRQDMVTRLHHRCRQEKAMYLKAGIQTRHVRMHLARRCRQKIWRSMQNGRSRKSTIQSGIWWKNCQMQKKKKRVEIKKSIRTQINRLWKKIHISYMKRKSLRHIRKIKWRRTWSVTKALLHQQHRPRQWTETATQLLSTSMREMSISWSW